MENLEKRMYFLVPYNISPIQQGIQAGHAVVEYGLEYNNELYKDWADNWKTFIILNGGTSNNGSQSFYGVEEHLGSMEENLNALIEAGIDCSMFLEPDLNYCLTGVAFIVDERVFNKKVYVDYSSWLEEFVEEKFVEGDGICGTYGDIHKGMIEDQYKYDEWVGFVGGEKNAFLREFLKNFRLA